MSKTLTHQPCPSCGGSDCVTIFPDGGRWCHTEGKYSPPPRKEKVESKQEELDLTFEHRKFRGVPKEVAERLNILTGVKPDGTEYSRVYPYPHAPKVRVLPKDFTQNKGFKNTHLLGMDIFNAGTSRVLTIVEGEDDWAAAYYMLNKDSKSKTEWPVVAVPGAAISKDLIRTCKSYIESFESIAICTDGDEAGERAATILETHFPNRCYRVHMSTYKDPMEYLENGASADWFYAWMNRSKYVMPFDTSTPQQYIDLIDEARDLDYLPTGIQGYDEVGLGLFQGVLTVFTAPEGIGKTEFMRMLEYGLVRDHPEVPFAYCHLEETPQRSVLGLCSYHLNKNVTRKDLIEDREEVDTAIQEVFGRENVHLFKIGTDEDPAVLIDRIKYYANVCGCKYVFFEPLQDIMHQRTDGKSSVEFLDQLAVRLSRVAAETGCGIVAIAHANEDGDVRDSKMIQKQAAVRVVLERDMESESEEERNTTRLLIRKNRPIGPVGPAGELLFNTETFTLSERIS